MSIHGMTEKQIRQLLNLEENTQINNVKKAQFSSLEPLAVNEEREDIEFLKKIKVEIEVNLGTATLTLAEIINLEEDSIIPLDKVAGDTVDIFVGDNWLIAGEVVVINDEFGIRVNSFTEAK